MEGRRQSETQRLAKKDGPPFISVIIPVLNVEATITRCVQSILGVDYPCDAFEVIVVDGGSEDSTISELSAFPDIKILQETGGRSVQAGISASNKPRAR